MFCCFQTSANGKEIILTQTLNFEKKDFEAKYIKSVQQMATGKDYD